MFRSKLYPLFCLLLMASLLAPALPAWGAPAPDDTGAGLAAFDGRILELAWKAVLTFWLGVEIHTGPAPGLYTKCGPDWDPDGANCS